MWSDYLLIIYAINYYLLIATNYNMMPKPRLQSRFLNHCDEIPSKPFMNIKILLLIILLIE